MITLNLDEISHFFNYIKKLNMDSLNKLFPRFNEYNDVYSERVKSALLLICSFSIIMMITSPIGWMYACFPRPFYAFIFYLHRIPVNAPPTPEWGIHYVTLFIYCLSAYIGIIFFEHQKIDKPFHKLSYIFSLTILSFFVPFELIYITLYDIFHSVPKYGFPTIWYGSMDKFYIFNSVILQDVVLTITCLLIIYLVKNDLNDYYKTKLRFNKISFVFLWIYIVLTVCWVFMPIRYNDLPEWGTNYFPQTVYFEYGNLTLYNVTSSYKNISEFGIVNEYWYPNDTIKILNHSSKFFSVLFMFYSFLPRRVDNGKNKI